MVRSIDVILVILLVSWLGMIRGDQLNGVSRDQEGFTFDQKVKILRYHNQLRRQAGAANMNQLFWHYNMEILAQKWASHCEFEHNRGLRHIGVFGYDSLGENLYLTTNLQPDIKFLESWFKEKANFHPNGTCISRKMCGHYGQIMWHNAEVVACGVKYCDPVEGSQIMSAGFLVVCDYGPLGNIPDKPIMNMGTACSDCSAGYTCVDELCAPSVCNSDRCQHGVLLEDVCMCNCTGTGYDGEFCETRISGDKGGPDSTVSGNLNMTIFFKNAGVGFKDMIALRICAAVYFALIILFMY